MPTHVLYFFFFLNRNQLFIYMYIKNSARSWEISILIYIRNTTNTCQHMCFTNSLFPFPYLISILIISHH
ncbi:hypothetical protein Hanom_Chr16g01475631 [Helianthus anomalus]